MFVEFEKEMKDEIDKSRLAASYAEGIGKSWATKVSKDELTFKFGNKGKEDSSTGFQTWKWKFELSLEHHAPQCSC